MIMNNILIYQNNNGNIKVDVRFEDETLWLSQAQICEVFGKAKSTISEHITAIFEEGELDISSTVRNYRTVQIEGDREIAKDIDFYNFVQNKLLWGISSATASELVLDMDIQS